MSDFDLAELTRSDGIVPVNAQTTASLIREVTRLRAALLDIANKDRTGFARGALGRIARNALNQQSAQGSEK
jgi:hypothetical protein